MKLDFEGKEQNLGKNDNAQWHHHRDTFERLAPFL